MIQDTTPPREPAALTIAGSDPSGGAGIQADLKTFTAHGVYGAAVISALTAQNTLGVDGVHAIPASFVRDQLVSVLADLDVKAAKTGMLASAEIVHAVAEELVRVEQMPVVVDPVMVATTGAALIDDDAVAAVREALVPRATVLTPNMHEAARLTGLPVATDRTALVAQGRELLSYGCRAVLMKGGHALDAASAADCLVTPDGETWLEAPRVETQNTHGTGCTLSAAIAAQLVRGAALADAVRAAKTFLTKALQAGAAMRVGGGAGPPDHLFELR